MPRCGVRNAGVRAQSREIGELPHAPGAQAHKPAKVRQVANLPNLAHIALHIRFKVIAEGLARFEFLIVNARITTRVQNVVYAVTRAGLSPFIQRKGQQAEQCSAPGQRLVDRIGEPELLAAREHEKAVFALFVCEDLQVGQENGHALDLVQDGTIAELREKAAGIGFGKFPQVGCFQVGVLEMGKRGPTKRGLPRLTRPGHCDKGILAEKLDQARCNLSRNHVVLG